ncbi:MAG: hypothetical protein ACM3X7_10250 [Solirubrobacterales bacterium]
MKKNIEATKESMKKNSEESAESKTGYNDIGNVGKNAAKQSTRNR